MPKDQSKLKVTNNIRCTTLLPPFFFRNSKLYCKKLVIHLWFKVLSITGHYFLPSFGSVRIPRRKNWSSFEAIHESNFLLLHKTGSAGQPGRVLLIETSDNQREQRLENTTGGVGLPILMFPSLDHFRNMGSSIVMLQNHFIVSLVVLRPFVFQCSAQTHQLHSIPIACDCFSRF